VDYKDVKSFIINWNNRFPVDRWWRVKHGIAFNSTEHQEFCFIDMYVEFLEDRMFDEIANKNSGKTDEEKYVPGTGNFLRKKVMTKDELQAEFDNISID
jgi:hypothetical protein